MNENIMTDLLYFPSISVPKTNWTLQTLLFYDRMCSIVPDEISAKNSYDTKGMKELVHAGLVDPITPSANYLLCDEFRRYCSTLEQLPPEILKIRQKSFTEGNVQNIHIEKLNYDILSTLIELKLAKKAKFDSWVTMETQTSNEFMFLLADIIATNNNLQPISTSTRKISSALNVKLSTFTKKRNIILKDLLPIPEKIDLEQLAGFRAKYKHERKNFRESIYMILNDPLMFPEGEKYKDTITEIHTQRNNLVEMMRDCGFTHFFRKDFRSIKFALLANFVGSNCHSFGLYTTLAAVFADKGLHHLQTAYANSTATPEVKYLAILADHYLIK